MGLVNGSYTDTTIVSYLREGKLANQRTMMEIDGGMLISNGRKLVIPAMLELDGELVPVYLVDMEDWGWKGDHRRSEAHAEHLRDVIRGYLNWERLPIEAITVNGNAYHAYLPEGVTNDAAQ